ncbi:MAG TPA: MBL fold metallo-hydrolase [Jatrophihabitans sp.]|jgi:glyoxylase-like metal-dependent hydrolase (beta-lactamase superfamily II)
MSDAADIEVIGLAQREAWNQRVMPPVEELRPDLWSIPVPIPNNPLRYTTVYCLATDSGVVLIDAGWQSDEVWQALSDGLALAGATIADVKGVLVTHQHYDHIGLAKRIVEASDAWVALHPADTAHIMSPEFRQRELSDRLYSGWLVSLGASEEEAWRLRPGGPDPELDPRKNFVEPDVAVEDGERLDIPGWSLRAVHTPGHTAGHLCFYDEKTDLMFAGDHVLPRISPNVSATPYPDFDALGEFLASQDKIAAYDSADVLPAHEWRFRGLKARAEQLKTHHQHRLDELLEIVRRMPGSVPWEMAGHMTWSRSWDQYDGFMRLSAVGETTAHLVLLVNRGLVKGTDEVVPKYFLA